MADAYYGEIRLFAGNFPPQNWAWCNGQAVSIQQYQVLYSIIGNLYGGSPSAGTFCLPDLCSAPVGWGKGPEVQKSWAMAEQFGYANVQLTSAQMPNHTHVPQSTTGLAAADLQSAPTSAVWANSGSTTAKIYSKSSVTPPPKLDALMDVRAVGASGGNGAHNNIQPCIGIYYIICLIGDYYPARP